MKTISLFNHKGGVSKTTTTFNLGWMLAEKGYKVILVDADPQCNLTGLVLGYKKYTELEDFYKENGNNNIRDGLAPAFESQPQLIQPVNCVDVEVGSGTGKLYLLPGNIRLSEYEVTLGIAQELSGSIQTLKNLPGAISYLLDKTAEQYAADFVLIDMSPSLGSINQNLLMTSDYFIVPAAPDYYSTMAIDSLASVLTKWGMWSKKAQEMAVLQEATYPYPQVIPKFLGVIIQNYRPRGGFPSKGFQHWIGELEKIVSSKFIPELRKISMLLHEKLYSDVLTRYTLETIPDFNTLIAKSQEFSTPVNALTDAQIQQTGTVLQVSKNSRDNFRKLFESMAEKVVKLIQ